MKKINIFNKINLKELIKSYTINQLSFSFAVGLSLAFWPPVGIHTILAIVISFIFKLCIPVSLFASAINNPWTLVPIFLPIYAFEVLIGDKLLDYKFFFPKFPHHISDTKDFLIGLKPVIKPLIIGCTVTSIIVFFVSYIIFKYFLKRYHFSKSNV